MIWATKTRGRLILLTLALFSVVFCLCFLLFVPSDYIRKGTLFNAPATPPTASPPQRVAKPVPDPVPPIIDNFPLALSQTSSSNLPPVPSWNAPPKNHVRHQTPLLIGFTRNWSILQQVVVSYITAGWPPSDIYVVENTGTMSSNKNDLLTLQNPFYLDYKRLTKSLGVNVISTPTLMSFAQLQNYFLWFAGEKKWTHYFWGHMDVVAISEEGYRDEKTEVYKSLYMRVVDVLDATLSSSNHEKWAIRFFAYDRLALVNVHAYLDVGGWDTMIGYYLTDCDMHERLFMKNYTAEEFRVGLIYDVGSSFDDLIVLYRRKEIETQAHSGGITTRKTKLWGSEDEKGSEMFRNLTLTLDDMQRWKNENSAGRNFWQGQQRGGQDEPFHIDSKGFEDGLQMTMEMGRKVFAEKWGHRDCDLRGVGLGDGDAWRMKHDW